MRHKCIPVSLNTDIYKTDFATLAPCCTTSGGGVSCKPGYCKDSPACNDFMAEECLKMVGGKYVKTDSNCKLWCNDYPDQCPSSYMQHYCSTRSGGSGGKSLLLVDTDCGNWCRDDPVKCDGAKISYCQTYPDSDECKCFNASNQTEYTDLMNSDTHGLLSQYSPFCVYSGCKGRTDLYDSLYTTDMKNTINTCPVGNIDLDIIDVRDSEQVVISDIDFGGNGGAGTGGTGTGTNQGTESEGFDKKYTYIAFVFLFVIALVLMIISFRNKKIGGPTRLFQTRISI
jgi:hypothetical protein